MRGYFLYTLILVLMVCPSIAMEFFGRGGPGGFNSFPGMQGNGKGGDDDEYYKILGVDRQASDNDIKKAYRRQAMQTHPDKGGDAEKFKVLSEAYEVLSDSKRRQMYDRFGKDAANGDIGSTAGFGGTQFSPSDFASDIFGSFGGGRFSMPLMYTIELSLEDLCSGRSLTVIVNGQELLVNIQPGMYDGVELRGQVHDSRGSIRDVVFVVQEKEHPSFKRSNADLYTELTISLQESLLGFERSIAHVDGSTFTMKSVEGEITKPDDVLVLNNLGMPLYNPHNPSGVSGRGRMFIKIIVEFPNKQWLNPVNKEALAHLLPPESSSVRQAKAVSNANRKAQEQRDAATNSSQKGSSRKSTSTSTGSTTSSSRAGISSSDPIIPKKASLKSFGDFGRPRRRSSSPYDEGLNFGSFFFR
mmetsp:Transcript_29940/g.50090  ORF Transcript_29940/g.50090 Transcript_29940/m.50090 type:complete len:415 (+) Transcript_29940:120-1364(+)